MSYNFLARGAQLPLSDLSVTYRTNIAGKIDIGGASTFSFYKYDYATQRRINKILLAEGRLPDMTNFSLNFSTSFQGKRSQRTSGQEPQQEEDSLRAEKQYNSFTS